MDSGFARGEHWSPDDAFLGRIKRSYRLAVDRYQPRPQTPWSTIDDLRNEVHVSLMSEDDERSRSLLSHPELTQLYYGIDTIAKITTEKLVSDFDTCQHVANVTFDHLVKAAQCLGALTIPNPEAKDRSVDTENIDRILAKIDQCMPAGRSFLYPNPFPGEFGILSTRGVIAWKVPMALYQAHRITVLAGLVGARVLEIGPGIGRTILHTKQLGHVVDYTTIDLPLGVVGQACFLGATLGPGSIWMIGDEALPQPGQIRLLPPDYLIQAPEDFDVFFNADSLTEMTRDQADAYFKYASQHGKVLFSINHEINLFRAAELPQGSSDVVVLRHPRAIRTGYVEEYFFFMPRLLDREKELERQVLELGRQADELERQANGLRGQVHELEHQAHGLRRQVHELEHQVYGLRGQVHALERQAYGLRGQVHELERQAHEQAALLNSRSRLFRHLLSLMRAKTFHSWHKEPRLPLH